MTIFLTDHLANIKIKMDKNAYESAAAIRKLLCRMFRIKNVTTHGYVRFRKATWCHYQRAYTFAGDVGHSSRQSSRAVR